MDSRRVFLGVSAIVFAASAAKTIASCASMAAMGEMAMPGGWALSMVWMRMPGQSWSGAAASFVGMWVVMMVAMMLPSLTSMLWRYGQAIGAAGATRFRGRRFFWPSWAERYRRRANPSRIQRC